MFKLGDVVRYFRTLNATNAGGAVDATVTQVHDDGAVGVALHDDSGTVYDRVEVHGPDTAPASGHYVAELLSADEAQTVQDESDAEDRNANA